MSMEFGSESRIFCPWSSTLGRRMQIVLLRSAQVVLSCFDKVAHRINKTTLVRTLVCTKCYSTYWLIFVPRSRDQGEFRCNSLILPGPSRPPAAWHQALTLVVTAKPRVHMDPRWTNWQVEEEFKAYSPSAPDSNRWLPGVCSFCDPPIL